MELTPRHILLAYKKNHFQARRLGETIARWLDARGVAACLVEAEAWSPDGSRKSDLAVVLGGDGTILGVARKLAGSSVPVFGINLGRVGFLTFADSDSWEESLGKALRGDTGIRERLALKWKVTRAGEVLASGVAINDVVLSRDTLARLVRVHVSVNGEYMGNLRGDGLIVCSPLGSSGYSVSAGGPILCPDLEVIGFTPICPFLTNVSPLALKADSFFKLRVDDASATCYLTIDGQEGFKLKKNDSVEVTGWPGAVRFLADETQFFRRLRGRGFSLEE